MPRKLLLCGGGLFIVLGFVLLVGALLKTGANDAEWRSISRTGLPSKATDFSWTEWRPNDGSVKPFPDGNRSQTVPSEFRIGHARGILFNFTVYEGRVDSDRIIPALGPVWGASIAVSGPFPLLCSGPP